MLSLLGKFARSVFFNDTTTHYQLGNRTSFVTILLFCNNPMHCRCCKKCWTRTFAFTWIAARNCLIYLWKDSIALFSSHKYLSRYFECWCRTTQRFSSRLFLNLLSYWLTAKNISVNSVLIQNCINDFFFGLMACLVLIFSYNTIDETEYCAIIVQIW